LEVSGADFALIASNTPHHRLDTIVSGIQTPVISIIDALARKSALIGARQVLLLGTDLTMRSLRFRKEFGKHGVEAAGPGDEAVRTMTTKLITELQRGNTTGASDQVAKIVHRCFDSLHLQPVVCLACTELLLAFETMTTLSVFEYDGIVFINSVMVHIDSAFEFAVAS
jgi:aspartate racemase